MARVLNFRVLNVRGLNLRSLGREADWNYTPSPTPTPEDGAYLVKAEGGGWQPYRLADGKYYIAKQS